MTDLAARDAEKRIALLGVPVEVGASQRGTLMGPAALRTAGLGPLLENLGFTVADHGDISARELVRIPSHQRRVQTSADHQNKIGILQGEVCPPGCNRARPPHK